MAADFGQTLEGLTMTAGERCAQRLPPCLALLEHSLEVLVECERGGGGGGGKASQDLCAYFELAHEVVGVVGQFLRERAKAEGFGDMAGRGARAWVAAGRWGVSPDGGPGGGGGGEGRRGDWRPRSSATAGTRPGRAQSSALFG